MQAVSDDTRAADLTARPHFDAHGQSAIEGGVAAQSLLVTAARLAGAPADDNEKYPCSTPVGHSVNQGPPATAGTGSGGKSSGGTATAGAGAGGAP